MFDAKTVYGIRLASGEWFEGHALTGDIAGCSQAGARLYPSREAARSKLGKLGDFPEMIGKVEAIAGRFHRCGYTGQIVPHDHDG